MATPVVLWLLFVVVAAMKQADYNRARLLKVKEEPEYLQVSLNSDSKPRYDMNKAPASFTTLDTALAASPEGIVYNS